ncbi:YadA-like family protein [Haemophilus haemolyticus]|uniref:YadA-like family protein n=1 Tax=Haemophilus haemolyticus TaxID=726 RepID=UPI001EFC9508|nr:YadA-like family protein [Haemophilus haemolyticus]
MGDDSKVFNPENGKSHGAAAIGGNSQAKNLGSLAVGYEAQAGLGDKGGNFSTAIGAKTKAPKGGVALGFSAEAEGENSLAIGSAAKSKDGYGATAFGTGSRVEKLEKGKKNTIQGQDNKSIEVDENGKATKINIKRESEQSLIEKQGETYGAIAFGLKASSHNLFSTALGAFSTVAAVEGTAVGGGSQVTGYRGSAFGMHSKAEAEKSLALGYESESTAYNSVALGASSLANRPNTVSVGDSNYNLYRQITNVADGTEDYDAVNVRQLNAVEAKIGGIGNQFTNINNHLDRVDTRMNRVGASAAALASLKHENLGVDDKFAVSVGVGNYKNTQAMAVGAVFKPSENVLLNLSGSMSGSEKMLGAGISWKFSNKHKPNLSTQSAVDSAEVLQLRQEVSAMQKELAELKKALRK